VLVGNWTEEAEGKILATLDPVGAMAQGDAAAYEALIARVQADGLWVRDLLHNTAAGLEAAEQPDEDGAEGDDAAAPGLPAMECQPFEHYDYLMLMFRHEQDFQRACEVLGIKKAWAA
jgi:hypothetical protein